MISIGILYELLQVLYIDPCKYPQLSDTGYGVATDWTSKYIGKIRIISLYKVENIL